MATLLLLLTIGLVVWTLTHPSPPHWSNDPAFRQSLREARRDRRRTDWARTRETWRTDLWRRGDGPVLLGLGLLAVAVIALCR